MANTLVLALVLLGVLIARRPSGWSCPDCAGGPQPPLATGTEVERPAEEDSPARRSRRPEPDLSTGVAGRAAAGARARAGLEVARADRRPAGAAARPAVPLAERVRQGPARPALPRPARRRRLGRDRGEPDHRRRRRRGDPRDRRPAARAHPGARHPLRRRAARAARRGAGRRARPEPGPHRCRPTPQRRQAGGAAGGRRQRLRQDHHLRQDRPGAGRRRPHACVLGAADTFRAAAADQLATWAGRVGAEVVRGPEGGDPAASRSTRSSGASRPAWTRC